MLENLTDEIRVCLRHAEECARKAAEASRPNARENFLEMQRRWLRLAHRYQCETAEGISHPQYLDQRESNGHASRSYPGRLSDL